MARPRRATHFLLVNYGSGETVRYEDQAKLLDDAADLENGSYEIIEGGTVVKIGLAIVRESAPARERKPRAKKGTAPANGRTITVKNANGDVITKGVV